MTDPYYFPYYFHLLFPGMEVASSDVHNAHRRPLLQEVSLVSGGNPAKRFRGVLDNEYLVYGVGGET